MIGSINDNIINTTELSLELILILNKHYPEVLVNRYGIDLDATANNLTDASKLLEKIAVKRGCLIKGGEPDLDRAAILLLDDFRSTKLGNITLEFPVLKEKVQAEKDSID
jgi:ribosome biogenesis GTPase A